MEALGKVGSVEVLALLGLNGAQRNTCVATNSALSERSTTKRTVLLGLGTVGSERVGQNTGRRSGVRTRRVVNRFCYRPELENSSMAMRSRRIELTGHGTLADKADERGVSSVAESESSTHYEGCGGGGGIGSGENEG